MGKSGPRKPELFIPVFPYFDTRSYLKIRHMQIQPLYPPNPAHVPESVTKPSPQFRREVVKVLGSLVLFFLVYILLILAALGLAIICVYGGILLIANLSHMLIILIGAGIIAMGVLVFFFLVKFLFAVSRVDRSGITEITEEEQPRLFAFVRQLAHDVGTPFPKKIYLSPDVNAAVFYDSSFWSMFLPVRKNLQIGMGLVNAINLSELKAVIAHEFGHFSQRSMKLGSFVYNVNKVLHNMLFENTGYVNTLNAFASVSGVFTFFAHITVAIVKGIQSVLRSMYGLVNKGYMGLSREMEFHADAVAASVSGSESLVTALRRVELADTSYQEVIRHCNELIPQKKKVTGLFDDQQTVLRHLAREHELDIRNGQVVITDQFLNGQQKNRVNFKDQWASHPLRSEREAHLRQLGIEAEEYDQPASRLFDNWENYQTILTNKIYEGVQFDGEPELLNAEGFKDRYLSEVAQYALPPVYQGYYDNRVFSLLKPEQLVPLQTGKVFNQVFSPERIAIQKKIQGISTDIQVLQSIQRKEIDVKTFDFDGGKYTAIRAAEVAARLEQEKADLEKELREADAESVGYFLQLAADRGTETLDQLKSSYHRYFSLREKVEETGRIIDAMMGPLSSIYQGQTQTLEGIQSAVYHLKNETEPAFKKIIQYWLEKGAFENNKELTGKLERFLQANHMYFANAEYINAEWVILGDLVNEVWAATHRYQFAEWKQILQDQLTLLPQ